MLHHLCASAGELGLQAFSKAPSYFPAFDVVAKIPSKLLAAAAFGCAQKSHNGYEATPFFLPEGTFCRGLPQRLLDRLDRLTQILLMISHQLQTAKQRFSFVAGRAAKGAPQLVTKHGKPFVVIVSADDWQVRTASKRPLWEALRACPVDLNELQISRSVDLPRKVVL